MARENDIVLTAQQALDMYRSYGEELLQSARLEAPDAHRPNDLQFMEWFARVSGVKPSPPGFMGAGPNGEVYPPELWESPEGIPVVDSAYLLDIAYWEGGEKDLKRWQGIIERTLA